MNILVFLTDLFLHLDVVLKAWVVAYPGWIYLMLFAVVFMETGAVVTPFLPGDSLLFAAGAISAIRGGGLDVWLLLGAMIGAAVLGDTANYSIGRTWGRRILDSGRLSRVITAERIARTEAFSRNTAARRSRWRASSPSSERSRHSSRESPG